MAFQLEVNQEIVIGSTTYRVAEHPAAPGMPYGQEGRQAIVYKLLAGDQRVALKVLKPRFRVPGMVGLAKRLASFASLPGLRVCERTVLNPQSYSAVLRQYPDLLYAVLMPWIEGPTWMEVVLDSRDLAPEQSLALARSMSGVLSAMEQEGLAHCDLSGPNVLLPMLAPTPLESGQSAVALVDVEQMFGPDLKRPELVPGGSPGYAHKIAPEGMWESDADRLSGAVLLVEMLGWCDERVRGLAWGESYFNPADEMQKDSERYHRLTTVLWERWGDSVARLFDQAWGSDTLADCPTFGEWLVALPDTAPPIRTSIGAFRPGELFAPEVAQIAHPGETTRSHDVDPVLRALMEQAHDFEEQNNVAGALDSYRKAKARASEGSGLNWELGLIVKDLEIRQSEEAARPDTVEPILPTYGVGPKPIDLDAPRPAVQTPVSPENTDTITPVEDTVAREQQPTMPKEAEAAAPRVAYTEADALELMSQAHKADAAGDEQGALDIYRRTLAFMPEGSGLGQELALIVSQLEANQSNMLVEPPPIEEVATTSAEFPGTVITAPDVAPVTPADSASVVAAAPPEKKVEPVASVGDGPGVAGAVSATRATPAEVEHDHVLELTDQARSMEASGDLAGALDAYRKALAIAPAESDAHQLLSLMVRRLEKRQEETGGADLSVPEPMVVLPRPSDSPNVTSTAATVHPQPQAPPPTPVTVPSQASARPETASGAGVGLQAPKPAVSPTGTKSGPPLAIVGVAVAVVLLVVGGIVFLVSRRTTIDTKATQTAVALIPSTQTSDVQTTVATQSVVPNATATQKVLLTQTATATETERPRYTYSMITSTGAITLGTTQISGPKVDDSVRQTTLPFPVSLYGITFTGAITISTEGNLQFNSSSTENANRCESELPFVQFSYAMMPFWTDLTMNTTDCKSNSGQCGIFTSLSGDPGKRIFNIEWRAAPGKENDPAKKYAHFEIRLYEDQHKFDFIYGDDMTSEGAVSTVAIQQNISTRRFNFISCNTPSIKPGMQITFTEQKKEP